MSQSVMAVTYNSHLLNKQLCVAELDDEVVAYMGVEPGEISNLFVRPDCAGKGIGNTLAELGLRLARQQHQGLVCLVATVSAKAFYALLGFEETATGYFVTSNGVKVPIVKMQR